MLNESNKECFPNPVESSEDSLYRNKITNEYLDEFNAIDFFSNICGLDNNDNDLDSLINNIISDIESGSLNSLLSNFVSENSNDFLIKEKKYHIKLLFQKIKKI